MDDLLKILRRADLRREVITLAVVTAALIVFALSRRHTAAMLPPGPIPAAAATAAAGPWRLRLLEIQTCPERSISAAVLEVVGPAIPRNENPVTDVSAGGLRLDGGEWSGSVSAATTLHSAGAGGADLPVPVHRGNGVLVLRFRGTERASALQLCLRFAGHNVCFSSVPVRVTPLSISAGRDLGMGR